MQERFEQDHKKGRVWQSYGARVLDTDIFHSRCLHAVRLDEGISSKTSFSSLTHAVCPEAPKKRSAAQHIRSSPAHPNNKPALLPPRYECNKKDDVIQRIFICGFYWFVFLQIFQAIAILDVRRTGIQ